MTPIDDYLKKVPPTQKVILERIREIVRELVPDAEEVISYGIPTFRLKGKNLVHFSGFAHHIGFYPTPSAISAFKDELAPYKQAKGSVQFPLEQPIPYELITKIVRYRTKELS